MALQFYSTKMYAYEHVYQKGFLIALFLAPNWICPNVLCHHTMEEYTALGIKKSLCNKMDVSHELNNAEH